MIYDFMIFGTREFRVCLRWDEQFRKSRLFLVTAAADAPVERVVARESPLP
jgi:hypothetical protein